MFDLYVILELSRLQNPDFGRAHGAPWDRRRNCAGAAQSTGAREIPSYELLEFLNDEKVAKSHTFWPTFHHLNFRGARNVRLIVGFGL